MREAFVKKLGLKNCIFVSFHTILKICQLEYHTNISMSVVSHGCFRSLSPWTQIAVVACHGWNSTRKKKILWEHMHHSIQHLHPEDSCGPSNHLSQFGFIGPVVLQRKAKTRNNLHPKEVDWDYKAANANKQKLLLWQQRIWSCFDIYKHPGIKVRKRKKISC